MGGRRAAVIALLAVAMNGCAQASPTRASHDTPATPKPPTATVSATPSVAPTGPVVAADLQATLNQTPLPPGSVRLQAAVEPSQPGISVANAPSKVTAVGYWRSPLSRLDTMTWLAAHLPPTWTGGGMGTMGGTTSTAEYDRKSSDGLEGPNLTFSVADLPSGSSIIVTAWEIPLKAKSAEESLTSVTAATVSTKDELAPMDVLPLRHITLDAVQAQRLASKINALGVDDGSAHGCTAGTPDVVMDFTTEAGNRKFLYSRDCHSLEPVGDPKGPVLSTDGPLYREVDALLKTSTGPVRGTLIVTLGPNLHTSLGEAGAIRVSRQGTVVDSGDVASGHIYIVTELPGAYDLTATSAGRTCKPGTATIVAERQVDVTLICTLAP